MNKKFVYYLIAVILVGGIPGITYLALNRISQTKSPSNKEHTCTQVPKICPNGTRIYRTGLSCLFPDCPTEVITTKKNLNTTTSTSTQISTTTTISENLIKQNVTPEVVKENESIFSKIASSVSSAINSVTSSFSKNSSVVSYSSTDNSTPPSTYVSSSSTSPYKQLPPENFAGEKYIVKDGVILSTDNRLIYTIPQEVINNVSSSQPGWTNTIINVVAVGAVAPVLPNNAIPIEDLPGKYYLSQNSFGNIQECEFSNKIFILDTIADTVTLMYEENNTTLAHDDPRACNSEIFLLKTEASNLILKYHTIGTNTLCDSAWSEPEKTFYLDVTKLRTEGMKKYSIPDNLSTGAEAEEEACRAGL